MSNVLKKKSGGGEPIYIEDLIEALNQGKSLAELRGLDRDTIEVIHNFASGAYERGDYEFARRAFLFLSLNDFSRGDYWYGLGVSFQGLGKCRNALVAFYMAISRIETPRISYEMGRCYFKLGEYELAKECFDVALKWTEEGKGEKEGAVPNADISRHLKLVADRK